MYLRKELAIKVRDHCLDKLELKVKVPSINRMSLLKEGGGYYLEIGIRKKDLQQAEQDLDKVLVKDGGEKVLAGPDGRLTVRIVPTGDMESSAGGTWSGKREPVRGGHRLGAEMGGRYGTLGCLVRLRRNGEVDSRTFFLSCHHVLSEGQAIGQYLEVLLPDNANQYRKYVGNLYWSIRNEHFDAAIGIAPANDQPNVAKFGKGFAWSRIRACEPRPGTAVDGQKVLVCGYESRESGIVKDTNTHLWLEIPGKSDHMFKDQIRTDSICKKGDSGAILFALSDSSPSLIPIGMAFCNSRPQDGDDGATYYNHLEKLFSNPFDGPTSLNDTSFQIEEIIVETET